MHQIKSLRPLFSVAAFLVYAAALLSALRFDGLASLASDGVHYLLMARHYSPWGEADPIAARAFAEQDFPPLFGILLGLVDAGSHFARAHLLTGILLLASLPLLRRYAEQAAGSRGIAFAVATLFALSPGAWMNSLDVLSENLFLVLSLVILLRHADPDRGIRASAIDGLLLAALILTRSVGVAMLAAAVLVGILKGADPRAKAIRAIVPAVVCLLCVLSAELLLGAGIPDQYLRGFARIATGEAPQGRIDTAGFFLSQISALGEAWLGNWLYYWGGGRIFAKACLAAAGAFGIAGMLLRLREGRLDSWYLLAYLAVILIWPHPGQMTRFIYPVAPLLLVAAADAALRIGAVLPARRGRLLAPLLVTILAAAVLPTLSYTWNRHRIGSADGLSNMAEFYRLPDLRAAVLEASVHAQIAGDIAGIAAIVPEDEAVMYYEPAYLALLARRAGFRLPVPGDPAAVREAAAAAGARYLLLTRIDPRHWRPGQNLLTDLHGYEGWTDVIFRRVSTVDGLPVSMLLRVRG